MIWGRTDAAKYDTIARARAEHWHSWFAWRPVRLLDGRWAWLQTLERISYYASEISVNAHATLNGWCFRP